MRLKCWFNWSTGGRGEPTRLSISVIQWSLAPINTAMSACQLTILCGAAAPRAPPSPPPLNLHFIIRPAEHPNLENNQYLPSNTRHNNYHSQLPAFSEKDSNVIFPIFKKDVPYVDIAPLLGKQNSL